MGEFLVELYVARDGAAAVEHGSQLSRLASEELTREGTPVRFLRSIFVPEDETCFHLYEAPSADAVREVARRVGLPVERVTEAVATVASEESPPCP